LPETPVTEPRPSTLETLGRLADLGRVEVALDTEFQDAHTLTFNALVELHAISYLTPSFRTPTP
jgi:hypothetical protein